MLAAHTVFVQTIIKVFFIIFLKDLWMVISLQPLSFSPTLLFFLCPALFVCVCVCVRVCVHAYGDAFLSSQVRLTLPFRSDVTEHVREARLNYMRGISICLRHHLTIYCRLTTLLPQWLSEEIHIGHRGNGQMCLLLPSPIIPIIQFNKGSDIFKFHGYVTFGPH